MLVVNLRDVEHEDVVCRFFHILSKEKPLLGISHYMLILLQIGIPLRIYSLKNLEMISLHPLC
jgi:hypothetical protein